MKNFCGVLVFSGPDSPGHPPFDLDKDLGQGHVGTNMRKPPKAGSLIAIKMRESLISGHASLRPEWSEVFQKKIAKSMSRPTPICPKKKWARSCKPYKNSSSVGKRNPFTLENDKLDWLEAVDPQKNAVLPLPQTNPTEKDVFGRASQKDFEEPLPPVEEAPLLKKSEEVFDENFFAETTDVKSTTPDRSMPMLITTDAEAQEAELLKKATPVVESSKMKRKACANQNEIENGLVSKKKKQGRPPKPKMNLAENSESQGNGLAAKRKRGRPPKSKLNSVENSENLGENSAVKRKRGRPPKSKVNAVENSENLGENSAVKRKRGRPPTTKQKKPKRIVKNLVNFSLPIEKVKPRFRIVPANKYVKKNVKGKPLQNVSPLLDDFNININYPNTKWSFSESESSKQAEIGRSPLDLNQQSKAQDDNNNNNVDETGNNFLKHLGDSDLIEQILEMCEQDLVQANEPEINNSVIGSKQAETETSPPDSNQQLTEQAGNNSEDEIMNNFWKNLDDSSSKIIEQILEMCEQDSTVQSDEPERNNNSVNGFKQAETETSPLVSNQQLIEQDENNNGNSSIGENTIPWPGTFDDLINFKFDVPAQKENEVPQDSVDSPINFRNLRQSIADDYNAKVDKIQEALAPHYQNWGLNVLALLRRSKERKRKEEGRILVRNRTKKTNSKQVHFCFE